MKRVKMSFRTILICAMASIAFFTIGNAAAGSRETGTYYEDAQRGWWFYEKEPEKPKEIEDEKKTVEPSKPKRHMPSMKDYTYEQLWNMHPDDFQPLLIEFQKKAVQTPSEANVKEYYEIQDIARRKSLAFANAAAFVMQKYPDMSVAKDMPLAKPGVNAFTLARMEDTADVLTSNRSDFALLYFYSPRCNFCTEQSKILKLFTSKYFWEIKSINMENDPGTAQSFGVERSPSLVLIYRNSQDYLPISNGVSALNEIESALFRGIKYLKGETTPETFTTYKHQQGGGFDATAPLQRERMRSNP
ncbi:MAG: hypothetical protein CSYNP_03996 [Syntrophus sp. SKADARSKE-3]|nr:hypothetical protein [Syntrophus sp. SKADARSKE-3]